MADKGKQLKYDADARQAILRGIQKLSRAVNVTLGPSGRNVILDKKRQDSNWSFNTGLDYAVQDWLGCGVNYALVTKNSNYEENDYVDNQLSVNLKIVY